MEKNNSLEQNVVESSKNRISFIRHGNSLSQWSQSQWLWQALTLLIKEIWASLWSTHASMRWMAHYDPFIYSCFFLFLTLILSCIMMRRRYFIWICSSELAGAPKCKKKALPACALVCAGKERKCRVWMTNLEEGTWLPSISCHFCRASKDGRPFSELLTPCNQCKKKENQLELLTHYDWW